MVKDLAKKNRSYRRFYEEKKISKEQLLELVECARFAACGGNKQVLRFLPVCTEEENAKLFKSLRWAGYFPEWDGPIEGERPTAYVVILTDAASANATNWDEGIAAQTILLAAVEQGFGGCMLANIDRPAIMADFGIDEAYAVKLVVALGVPKEKVVIDDIHAGEDIKYYREADGTHHVPKVVMEELVWRC